MQQKPAFLNSDRARVGRCGGVHYGWQTSEHKLTTIKYRPATFLLVPKVYRWYNFHLLDRALQILLQQGLVRMASSWGRIASTRALCRWPCHGKKNTEHDKCNVTHTEWCTKMMLHTNLGVEKGSVNDIVGIRVLQQLLKVRPTEQEQFMYYDSFGIVREKL